MLNPKLKLGYIYGCVCVFVVGIDRSIYLPLVTPVVVVVAAVVVTADASEEYVEDRDILLLALIVVASVIVFTSEADGVIAADVVVTVWGLSTVPAMVAISPRVVVDIELDDCEDEFSR